MRIAIVDDRAEEIRAVKEHLARAFSEEALPDICGFSSAQEYQDHCEKSEAPFDVLFLDIMLAGGQNGIELARTILEQNAGLILVFMSANPSYFRDVYKVRHTYFLTKPIDAYYFDDCIRRIRAQLSMRRLVLDIGGENRVIELQNVLYLESALRKTIFHFRDGSTLSVNRRMQEVEEAIPSPAFARVHKSFIVNLDNVAGIERSCVMFDDKTKVNISRPFIKSFREKTALYFNQVL